MGKPTVERSNPKRRTKRVKVSRRTRKNLAHKKDDTGLSVQAKIERARQALQDQNDAWHGTKTFPVPEPEHDD